MSREDLAHLTAAIAQYDGKGNASLQAITARIAPSPVVLQALCEFVGSDDARVQSASTWLLRRYVSAGATLSPRQTEAVLSILLRGSHLKSHQVSRWEARLHILQMMGDLTVPATCVEQLWRALGEGTADINKFIRAWSYSGLAVIADQDPTYRGRALSMLAAAEQEEAASVRARARQIRKTFKWASI